VVRRGWHWAAGAEPREQRWVQAAVLQPVHLRRALRAVLHRQPQSGWQSDCNHSAIIYDRRRPPASRVRDRRETAARPLRPRVYVQNLQFAQLVVLLSIG